MWPSVEEFTASWIADEKLPAEPKIEYWLYAAQDMVLEAVPSIEARVMERKITEMRLKRIVIDMVTRVFLNKNRIRSYQESMSTGGVSGQGSTSFAGSRLGELYVSPEELATLRGKSRRKAAFSVVPR